MGWLPEDACRNAPPTKSLDDQFTPTEFYKKLDAEFHFTLDPCASRESAKCRRYFTKKKNGLRQSWRGARVFLNPPYSNIGAWLEKARKEIVAHCCLVVALLPSWTDRKWWQEHIEHSRDKPWNSVTTRFLPGRITFGCPGNPEGVKRDSASFPSVLVIWYGGGR